jgi:surface protein
MSLFAHHGHAERTTSGGGRSRRLRCSWRPATSACWLLATLALCGSVRAQTALTDANIRTAVAACLAVDPVGGICPGTPYGSMPGWDTSAVTDMSGLFQMLQSFNADISAWNVGQVTRMDYSKSRPCGRCCRGPGPGGARAVAGLRTVTGAVCAEGSFARARVMQCLNMRSASTKRWRAGM